MKTIMLLLILSLSFNFTAFAYEDIEILDQSEGGQPDFQSQQLTRRQQQYSMKRTACLVLSRYHSNNHKEMIESVITELQPEQQNKYINKMYATAVEHCLPLISIEEAQQFFVQNSQFNPVQMFHIYDGFDYSEAANSLNHLTAQQKLIIKFIKQFDEQMSVKKEEREAQQKDSGINNENEITIMGIAVHGWTAKSQIIYLLVFFIIAGVGIYWGFQNLSNSSNPKKLKKKDKKKGK